VLRVGIEQEFVCVDASGTYLDADTMGYALFSSIVDEFPSFEGDDVYFECKSLETFPKRCYVEGFERHAPDGKLIETLPKALEIRTLPHAEVSAVVKEFCDSYNRVMDIARSRGLEPVLTSRHPFKATIDLGARLDEAEKAVRTEAELALAVRAMLTHGVHVNVSLDHFSEEEMSDLVEKINFYMPALIPWSFSSPFYLGAEFDGLCSRNYYRAETRRMADLHHKQGGYVLEFRGFDACGDARLLQAVLTLYCAFIQDDSLPGRLPEQDPGQLQRSSLVGFADPEIREQGRLILAAARAGLNDDDGSLDMLETRLNENDSYASRMKNKYAETGSILESISGQYDFSAPATR
jgi:hypothetical protein